MVLVRAAPAPRWSISQVSIRYSRDQMRGHVAVTSSHQGCAPCSLLPCACFLGAVQPAALRLLFGLPTSSPACSTRSFRRSKAVTPSTTLHGPTLARGRPSAHSRGREEVKRQCSDGGFCRQNLVSEKRRLHVISSDLQPLSGLLHPHPTCRCPRPEASCRTHPPYPCCCGLSGKAGLCFSWLRGGAGLCAVQPAALRLLFGRRAAYCPAPAFWASHLLPSLLR